MTLSDNAALDFLKGTRFADAALEPITGDASTRRYFRLRKHGQTAILMDASRARETVPPFVQINLHLQQLGLSVPELLVRDEQHGLLLLEDFGDQTFSSLLDAGSNPDELYSLATDVLVTLHQHPLAIPAGLRAYDPEKMLADVELFLDWCAPGISEPDKTAFRTAWHEVLPLAHRLPASLLLRDYHAANLMLLPSRPGVRRAGLLDFQDAYQGPVTYDLVSLLEDARRDVPGQLRQKMIARYLDQFPTLDREAFSASLAILAALRHTRVLAIFERLARHEGRPDYRDRHSPRVQRLLLQALQHPALSTLKQWMTAHAH